MDLTSWWAFWQRYKHLLGFGVAALVIFGTGWQLGRVMSPYYAAHPIVFEDNHGADVASAGGSIEQLTSLREAGTAQAALADAPAVVSPTPTAVVAGVVSSTVPSSEKLFVGSVNSDKYHHKDCASGRQIKEENQIWFGSVEEAEKAGYTASKCTAEKLSQPGN